MLQRAVMTAEVQNEKTAEGREPRVERGERHLGALHVRLVYYLDTHGAGANIHADQAEPHAAAATDTATTAASASCVAPAGGRMTCGRRLARRSTRRRAPPSNCCAHARDF